MSLPLDEGSPGGGSGAFTGGPGGGADGEFRIAGADCCATAAQLSRSSWEPGAPVAYLATGRGFADALAAGPARRRTRRAAAADPTRASCPALSGKS